ncbi:MAG: ABC transporter permease [Limnochordia bacterium]|jgi:peptide/nickel transport system permease protein|nr:ABC transporter permease [Limnochordia bacterium]MDI9465923.1 ABC transporter permease [Bacillota bacterium]NLO94486.1 ABC transporter permease [Bacillota bacterium]HOB40487.1 ABC transporter permease [Limnochordia bacterium]HPZ79837.1 ABC transporter permease [Limnochordia bacterium]
MEKNNRSNHQVDFQGNGGALRSPWKMAWRKLRRHRLALMGMWVLILLHVFAIFADFFAPYSELTSDRRRTYHPPTKIHIFHEGKLVRPFVYEYKRVDTLRNIYEEDTSTMYPIRFFVRGDKYSFLGFETDIRLFGVDAPGKIYLFGADRYGRDIFSRLAYGGRRSLFIGIIGLVISLSIGLIYGGVSGYFGGWVDNLMMRIAEIIISIPSFYLLLALSAVLPTNIPPDQRFMLIVAILGFIGWAGLARVIRGMVLSIAKSEFVAGAEAIGASQPRIIIRHILPNTMSYVIVNATLSIPGFILSESGLSFIGVGIQHPVASWGNMLSEALNLSSLTRYPWLLVPGFFIFITVLSYSFFGDGVRDALDPRSRTV